MPKKGKKGKGKKGKKGPEFEGPPVITTQAMIEARQSK